MVLKQSIVSIELFQELYLGLLSNLDVILYIKSLDTNPGSVLVGLISLIYFLSLKFCLWSLNKM